MINNNKNIKNNNSHETNNNNKQMRANFYPNPHAENFDKRHINKEEENRLKRKRYQESIENYEKNINHFEKMIREKTDHLEKIKLEKGRLIKEKTWEEFRSFVVLEVERNQHNSDEFFFQSKGKRFYFGSFLNDEDKLILKNELKRIINQLNTLSPGL